VFYEPAGVRIARFDAQEDGVTFLGYFLPADGQQVELAFPELSTSGPPPLTLDSAPARGAQVPGWPM